jgi:GxxExxY protein
MAIDLRKLKFSVHHQRKIKIYYASREVGGHLTDLFIEDLVIFELKHLEEMKRTNEVQLTYYLRISRIEFGLLLNL